MTHYLKDIALSAQKGLIAMITPNMRSVSVGLDQEIIKILFVFDSEISIDDKENMHIISNNIIADYDDLNIEVQSITIPDSDKLYEIPEIYTHRVYHRKEII